MSIAVNLSQKRALLFDALRHFIQLNAKLLTAGQRRKLKAFLEMTESAQSVYATLLQRTHTTFIASKLNLPLNDLGEVSETLESHGFIWVNPPFLSTRRRLELMTKEELMIIGQSNQNTVKSSWKKSKIIHTLTLNCDRELLPETWVLRHDALFKWIFDSFCHNHTGDTTLLTRINIGQLQTVGAISLQAKGKHANRQQRRAYQIARKWTRLDVQELYPIAANIREQFKTTVKPPDWRMRFSALRFGQKAMFQLATGLLQKRQKTQALADFQLILSKTQHPEAALKIVRILEQMKRHTEAVDMCQKYANSENIAWRYQFERTGRRLKKKANKRWIPLPPLPPPKERQLRLNETQKDGPRPKYTVGAQEVTVEGAVIELLKQHNRQALFAESSLWRSLFAALFKSQIFLPINNMLPSKYMTGPLDFYSDSFYERRHSEINAVLEQIAAGKGAAIIESAKLPIGLRIDGLRLDAYSKDLLIQVVNALGGDTTVEICKHLLRNPGHEPKGLPDLFVLPGPSCRIEGLFPRQLPSQAFSVEIKTPTDTLSDRQRMWLHRLTEAGHHSELWKIKSLAR